jgi:hypothetical protein
LTYSSLKMEAILSSETTVDFQRNTRCFTLEERPHPPLWEPQILHKFKVISVHLQGRTEEKHEASVRIIVVLAEIRTRHIPNPSHLNRLRTLYNQSGENLKSHTE